MSPTKIHGAEYTVGSVFSNHFKSGVANYALTIQVLNETTWTSDIIERRQQALLAKA